MESIGTDPKPKSSMAVNRQAEHQASPKSKDGWMKKEKGKSKERCVGLLCVGGQRVGNSQPADRGITLSG